MILGIAIVLVLVLLAIALVPKRKPTIDLKQSLTPTPIFPSEPARNVSLRQQQVIEEASAIAAEYQKRADEAWLDELRGKAATILGPAEKATKL